MINQLFSNQELYNKLDTLHADLQEIRYLLVGVSIILVSMVIKMYINR